MRESAVEYHLLTRTGQIRHMRRLAMRALTMYRIEPVSLDLLGHSFHTTFRITTVDGAQYVLHILRPDTDSIPEVQGRARVESEMWWLDQLRMDLDLPLPVPVRTPRDERVVSAALDDLPPSRFCTLFHWIDGRFFREGLKPMHLRQVGQTMARLHNHSESLQVPADFTRPEVDVADQRSEEGVVRLVTDNLSADAGQVMHKVFEQVRHAQNQLGSERDVFGLIHADIHQKNYMFSRGIVRLIDFGDCGWGHFLYDPAVTIHQLRSLPQRTALRMALLAGYREVRHLSPEHEALLDTFVMLREVQDLSWLLQQRDDPSYLGWMGQIQKGVKAVQGLLAMSS